MMRTLLLSLSLALPLWATAQTARMARPADIKAEGGVYVNNRAPLRPNVFLRLPPGSVTARGWVGEMLRRQRDGLCGHLGSVSDWLDKKGNAWLEPGGSHGWEEVPYWLRGYSNLAYALGDEAMLRESRFWIEAILSSAGEDGYFGPVNANKEGRRELWANMLALQILQDYYEHSGDGRVLRVMGGYFKWQLAVPDNQFLRDYWENSRGGDNLLSAIWLYNRTGDPALIDLMHKLHRCTANWMQESGLPNWHNVNVAECFREPAEYYLLTGQDKALRATYDNYSLVRRVYGQVPGGMFGGDENCRHGHVDPRQGTETCGFVEQMLSDEILMAQTGDILWAENLEDVAFNSLPAAMTEDMRALRYLTCPNMVQSDSRNHHPGVDNSGPFFSMNPFSSRCCQHNHAMGWPYYAAHLVMASADGGAALLTYSDCSARMRVRGGREVVLDEATRYPFGEDVTVTVSGLRKNEAVEFPLYLRVPSWTPAAHVAVNGQTVDCPLTPGLLRLSRPWRNGDRVALYLPMRLATRVWALNKNSVSLDYGPLTMSLLIKERYERKDSRQTAIFDSHWQEGTDPAEWPAFEIYADSPWNYALRPDLSAMSVERGEWPRDNYPWSQSGVPLRVQAPGARVEGWGTDETGLCQTLPGPDAPRGPEETLTLIPMGAARLRISAFPPAK